MEPIRRKGRPLLLDESEEDKVIGFLATAEMRRLIDDAAARSKKSRSEFMRDAALRAARRKLGRSA